MGDPGDYEPGDHREFLKHPTNFAETLIHFSKACIGTGIMAMPNAFSEVGWVMGLIATLGIGSLCVYMTNRLAISSRRVSIWERKPQMTYVELSNSSLKYGPEKTRNFKYFGDISNIFLIVYQFGCSCIYVVFVAGNVKHIWDYFYPGTDYDIRIFMAIIMIPQCIVSLVDNYKYLAYFSLVADFCTLAGFIIFFACYLLVDMDKSPPIGTFNNGVTRYPMFVATVFFSMEAIAIVLPLENEMKQPKYFTGIFGVINISMIPCVIMYAIFGFFGYMKYGDDVKSSATYNLPVGEGLAQAILIMMCFAIYVTYHLSAFVTYDLIWKSYLAGPEWSKIDNADPIGNYFRHYLLRLAIIVGTNLLAMGIPNVSLFISLLGALTLSMTGFAFVVIIWICIHWDKYTGVKFTLFITYNCVLIVLAFLVLILGVGQAIYDIAIFYTGEQEFT